MAFNSASTLLEWRYKGLPLNHILREGSINQNYMFRFIYYYLLLFYDVRIALMVFYDYYWIIKIQLYIFILYLHEKELPLTPDIDQEDT